MQATPLERKIVNALLAGEHPVLAELREQAAHLSVRSREKTGVGVFTNFEVDRAGAAPIRRNRVVLGDGVISTPRLQHGAGSALFVENGYISTLEVFTYDEPWPDDIDDAELTYTRVPRDLSILNVSDSPPS